MSEILLGITVLVVLPFIRYFTFPHSAKVIATFPVPEEEVHVGDFIGIEEEVWKIVRISLDGLKLTVIQTRYLGFWGIMRMFFGGPTL